MSAAQSASVEAGRLKLTLDSCGGIPRNGKKTYAYYVSFATSTAAQVKSRAQPVSGQNAVVWLEELYIDFASSSTINIILYEKHRIRDQIMAQSTVAIAELWEKKEILLPVLDEQDGDVCALRLVVADVQDGSRGELDQAVAAVAGLSTDTRTSNAVSKIEDAVSIGTSAVSSIGAWGPLFEKVQAAAELVEAMSEVHPYTKLAWGVLSAGYELAKKQKERDENVAKLIEALCNAYDMVLGMDGLKHQVAAQTKAVAALVKTTISCGHFVETYLKRGFWGRAFRGLVSSADKDIKGFETQFEQLQQNLTTFTAISTQHHVQAILGSTGRIEDAIQLSRMPFTPAAQWRTGRKCLPGTRKEIISQVLNWAHLSSDETPRVLLLTGVAGVGKSSIANTIASDLQDMGCLAASYCFDQNNVKEHRPELLIPTIAHQLASAYPVYQHALASNSPTALGTPDLDDQFDNLLLRPLGEQTFAEPLFVVVDALDESGDLTSRAKLVNILAARFVELPPQIRLILTSRPEEDVLSAFDASEHAQVVRLDTDGNDKDIELFIASKLVDRTGKPLVMFSSADHALLASKAEGLFQWAAVVCASITQGKNRNLRPTSRQMRDTYERFISLRSGALDVLYDETLMKLFSEPSEDDQLLARALGLVVASQQPLSAASIFEILNLSDDEQELCFAMLQNLGALLTGVSNQDEPIRTLHSSFRDYLFQTDRNQRFHIDQDVIHCDTALGCLRVLNEKLKFNICGLETSYVANENVPGLAEKISKHVSPSLSYAAQFWGYHIQCTNTGSFRFDDDLGVLLREKFLFWLELLSLVGAVNVASPTLNASGQHIATDELKQITTDYRRFVRAFGQAISRAAPHVYLSAYAFSPTTAFVNSQSYSRHLQHLPKLNGSRNSWPRSDVLISGHENIVTSVAFSPDGRHIVSGSWDWTVRIWDAETGTAIEAPLKAQAGSVTCVAYSPDGRYIASGFEDGTINIWDARTGFKFCTSLVGHIGKVNSVAYSPDCRRIVSGSEDRTVCVYDAETSAIIGPPFRGHTGPVNSVAYSFDGRCIVSGSSDMTVRIWNAETGAAVCTPLEGHEEEVCCVAYSPDGRHVVSGSSDRTVRVWDSETGALVGAPFEGHASGVLSLAYSPDGRYIVSGSADETMHAWDAETGAAVGTPFEGHIGSVTSLAYSLDGRYIVSGSWDQTIRIWDAESINAVSAPHEGHIKGINCVAYSPDGRHIVSGGDFGKLHFWDAEAGAIVGAPLEVHDGWVRCVAYSPDGRRIVSSSSETMRVWDAETGEMFGEPLAGHTNPVISVVFSPDSRYIASGSEDRTVRIWNAETGAAVGAPFEGHTHWIRSVAYSPDGRHIVSGSFDKTVRIWDAETGAAVGAPFEGHTDQIHSVAYSPDGRRIVSGSWDQTVRIWDAETGAAVGPTLEGHTSWVYSVAYSPDGRSIVSGSTDRTVRIWDAETGAAVGTFEGHKAFVNCVAQSPDGRRIVSGSDDKILRIWDRDTSDLHTKMRTFSRDERHALRNYPCTQTPCSQDQLELPPPLFRLTDSGWIEDMACNPPKLLLWIPVECRTSLYLPPTLQVVPHSSSYSLDLSDFAHGVRWTECYNDGKQ